MHGLGRLYPGNPGAYRASMDLVPYYAWIDHEKSRAFNGSWQAVVEATKWRIAEPAEIKEEKVADTAASNGDDLPGDLQKAAQVDRTSRILEYFNKS